MIDNLAFLNLGLPCIVSSLQLVKNIVPKLKKTKSGADATDRISG